MTRAQRKKRNRIAVALVIFLCLEVATTFEVFDSAFAAYGLWVEFAAFLVPYILIGHDVLAKAWHGITHRQPFDENLLMSIATLGAFALVFFPEAKPHMAEGAAVMLFYQIGCLFESYAVGKTRKSIAAMMDIAPEFATILTDSEMKEVDPNEVPVGSLIICKPGERIPLDGIVESGKSQLDTSALTGEAVPRPIESGSRIQSGCVNLTGKLAIRTTSIYKESTVARILDLVENASEKKTRTENFISRFARIYTPVVVLAAIAIALVSPFAFGIPWSQSVCSALIFLVVSCPCALVISVPLSFFGGIGAASRSGIMVKGSSYLEALAQADTIAFDKTGTLTDGTFGIVAVHTPDGISEDLLLSYAAHAEMYSDHPIALSVVKSFSGSLDRKMIEEVEERSGQGVAARINTHEVLVGNGRLMEEAAIPHSDCNLVGTILHVAVDGSYAGHIVIADTIKDDAAESIRALHEAGIKRCVMLTGDRADTAAAIAAELGVDDYRAQLMPDDKVAAVESLMQPGAKRAKVAFVGDGINDAPVLMRADVGIAMGGMGSDAAIEAADIVLMDDRPSDIAFALRIARKTMHVVKQNIAFALSVKIAIMVMALPAIGISTMWLAVFGDVGVSVLAILNAMRCLRIMPNKQEQQ